MVATAASPTYRVTVTRRLPVAEERVLQGSAGVLCELAQAVCCVVCMSKMATV